MMDRRAPRGMHLYIRDLFAKVLELLGFGKLLRWIGGLECGVQIE